MYNFTNYWYRQVFVLSSKEELSSEEQEKYEFVLNYILSYNEKRERKGKSGIEIPLRNNQVLPYNFWAFMLKDFSDYKELPSQTAQQVLKMVARSWKGFLKSIQDYWRNPSKYLGKPKIPKYLDKNGRYPVIFTNQQLKLKENFVHLTSSLKVRLFSQKEDIREVRIIPQGSSYKLEIVYSIEKEKPTASEIHQRIAGIDLGLDNFITMVNNIGEQPIVVKGGALKSKNQYYNKRISKLKRILKHCQNQYWSRQLEVLTKKRERQIQDFIHKVSKTIVDYCIQHNIDTLVVGKNKNWKQKIHLGTQTNQQFVQIPHSLLLEKLRYKCEEYGIHYIETEESYTSKANFIQGDEMKKETNFTGKRIYRGLYKTKDVLVNADVNAAYNIIRKVFPNHMKWDSGCGLHPTKVCIV